MATNKILLCFLISFFYLMLFVSASSIDSVDWDKYMTKYYEERYVLAKTTGFSDGTSATVEIWEDDGVFGPSADDDFIESFSSQVKNNRIITNWGGGDGSDCLLCNNAEYYAKVKIGSTEKSSWDIDFKANGDLGHNEGDCDFDYQCQNKLYCEGIPATSVGGGGFEGDGCCYDYENWNTEDDYCNYAIKGQVFNVVTNSNGKFNSEVYPNLNLFFVVYDDSSLLGRILGNPFFVDYVSADSNGNFKYNPEFNRQNEWNSNILFDWNVEIFALDENNNLIAKWTNSFTNDNDKYKKGLDYIDQRVRIHTDKPYWKSISDDIPINKLSSRGFKAESMNDEKQEVVPLTEEQESQIKLIKNKITLERNYESEGKQEGVFAVSSAERFKDDEKDNESETEEYNEEVLYNLWKGILLVEEDSEYYFNASIIGGYKLDIDGETIVNSLTSEDSSLVPIFLEEGEHNITIEYVHLIDREAPNLFWNKGDENNFRLIPSSSLLKQSFNFQYYNMDLNQDVAPIEKFNEEEKLNSLIPSSNQLSTKGLSTSSQSSNYYQVSFLEAPRESLHTTNEPLILVHGLNGESGYFDGHFEDNLKSKGYDIWKFYYPNDQKIDYSGALLSDGISYVKSLYATSKVKIVSHSMGGLVTRSYIEGIAQDLNGKSIPFNNDISKFVMLAPPNYGSYLANRVLNDEDMGAICSTLNEVIGWLISGKSFTSWDKEAPAYTDLAIGSDFLWRLNSQNTTADVDMLVIGGKSQSIPCIPFEADYSDDLVSISSASRLNLNVPLILINKNHLTIYKQFGGDANLWEIIYGFYSGNVFTVAKNLINAFIQVITSITNVSEIIDQFLSGQNNFGPYLSTGEVYLNPRDSNANANSFNEGGALIKVNENPIGQIKIANDSVEYYFTQNPQSKIFYHFNYDENSLDYGSSIPKGEYRIYFNSIDTGEDIEIKPVQTIMKEIDLPSPCSPNLIYTSWSSWENISCLQNNLMNQSRFRVLYDSENCGTITNQTFYEFRNILPCGIINVPINLTINSPKINISDERRVLFNIETTEEVDEITYEDLKDRRPRERRLCRDCDFYDREKSFREGNHTVVFRAYKEDEVVAEEQVSFFVDYRDPKISKTEPRRGFTDGNFYVKFKEESPTGLKLFYGNSIKEETFEVGEVCEYDGRRYYECEVEVNVSMFDGKEIEYWFEVEDIAGHKDESRKVEVDVDITPPNLTNPDSFWERGEGRYSKYIYFDMSITEKNFDEVVLSYDYRGRNKEKRLCSRLRYGVCEKRFTVRDDYTNLKLIIRDNAGNEFEKEINLI